MEVNVDLKKIQFSILLLYPLADIAYNTFSSVEHYTTFSLFYICVYFLTYLTFLRGKIDGGMVVITYVCALYITLSYALSGSALILFLVFLLFLKIGAKKIYLEELSDFLFSSRKFIWTVMVMYFVMLVCSVVFQNGIHGGWNTTILYGPFALPHTLAYEALVLEALGLILYKLTARARWILAAFLFQIVVLLTSVRSALLASVVLLLAFYLSFNKRKKIILLGMALGILGLLVQLGLMDQVIEKTLFAIQNGSITNGRDWLIDSSIQIFIGMDGLEKLFGIGHNNLLLAISYYLGTAMHSHNDIFTVLISYGVIPL